MSGHSVAFRRGYFCAVATMLRMEGAATTPIRELFAAGGDPSHADKLDQSTFREFGLMPNPPTP